jgi:radical SAM superfamily enzyme YgiQ (UPF0313 family)
MRRCWRRCALVATSTLSLEKQRFIRWETQRGCPFRCSFCQHRESGVRLRRRSLALSRIDAAAQLDVRLEFGLQTEVA